MTVDFCVALHKADLPTVKNAESIAKGVANPGELSPIDGC